MKSNISKMEDREFIFTGIDVKSECRKIKSSINDYAQSLEIIKVRKWSPYEDLTREELKFRESILGSCIGLLVKLDQI